MPQRTVRRLQEALEVGQDEESSDLPLEVSGEGGRGAAVLGRERHRVQAQVFHLRHGAAVSPRGPGRPHLPASPRAAPAHLLLDVGGEVGGVQLQRLQQRRVFGQQLQDGSQRALVRVQPGADLAEARLLRGERRGGGLVLGPPAGLRPGSSCHGCWLALTAWKPRLWH